jgi:hypothetical protein
MMHSQRIWNFPNYFILFIAVVRIIDALRYSGTSSLNFGGTRCLRAENTEMMVPI